MAPPACASAGDSPGTFLTFFCSRSCYCRRIARDKKCRTLSQLHIVNTRLEPVAPIARSHAHVNTLTSALMAAPAWCSLVLGLAACLLPAGAVQEGKAMPHMMTDLAAQLDRDCSLQGTCAYPERYGDAKVNYGPSRGYFPGGCRWREVFGTGRRGSVLEYWNASTEQWADELPKDCTLKVRSCLVARVPPCLQRSRSHRGQHVHLYCVQAYADTGVPPPGQLAQAPDHWCIHAPCTNFVKQHLLTLP